MLVRGLRLFSFLLDRAEHMRASFRDLALLFVGVEIPRFGFDSPDGWSCTGPLVRDFHLDVRWNAPDWVTGAWIPDGSPLEHIMAKAPSAPEAIARLVVKLAEIGKLEKVEK